MVFSFSIIRLVLAAALLSAAWLKCYQLATGPVEEDGLLRARWFLISTVEVELGMAAWLVSGVAAVALRGAAIGLFSLLGGVALATAWAGETSCGCWGAWGVSPWVAAGFDIAAVAALCRVPRPRGGIDTGRRLTMTAALWALIAGPALWAMTLYEPARLTGDGQIAGAGTQVALEPEQWIGQPFPLRDYLEVPDDLSTARWVVVLISPDCSLCRQAATRYGRIASDLAGHPESPRWALVTLPGDSAEGLVADGTPAIVGRLSDRVAWHMPVPVEITLRDGVVTGVRTKVIPRIEDFVGL